MVRIGMKFLCVFTVALMDTCVGAFRTHLGAFRCNTKLNGARTSTGRTPHRRAVPHASAVFAGEAATLFNNMKTPASILAGALIPIGFLSDLPEVNKGGDSKMTRARQVYLVVATASFCSQLLSIMWATVAVNQLTETVVLPTNSVFELLQRDYELPWVATNAHFLFGMFGFMSLIGFRSYLAAASSPFGLAAAGWAASGLALMAAIVNRGVAANPSSRGSMLALFTRYFVLICKSAVGRGVDGTAGPLELIALALACGSTVLTAVALRSGQ